MAPTERTLLRCGSRSKAPRALVRLLSILAGLSNGFNQSIVGGAVARLDLIRNLSSTESGMITSALCIGGAVGCVSTSPVVRRYGKRMTTIIAETLATTTILLQGVSTNPYVLATFRIGVGFGSALCVVVKPLYVAELSLPAERATTVSLYAWGFSAGLCAAQSVDAVFPDDGGLWRYPLMLAAIFPLLMLGTVMRLPATETGSAEDSSLSQDCATMAQFVSKLVCPCTESAVLAASLLLANQWTGMALLMTDTTEVLAVVGISDPAHEHWLAWNVRWRSYPTDGRKGRSP